MSSIFRISEALKIHLGRGHSHSVQLKDPSEVDQTSGVSVWLFQVQPDEFSRNSPAPVLREAAAGPNAGDPAAKRKRSAVPPFGLNLYYLVTPTTGNVESDQEVLGRMLLTIHESPMLRVQEPESGQDEQVRIILPGDSLEDRIRLWDSLKSKPYRLSFTCVVRTARLLSSISIEEAPVLSLSSSPLPESPWN